MSSLEIAAGINFFRVYLHSLCGDSPHSTRSRGGTGRRVRLRTVWGNPWRFESSREHHFCSGKSVSHSLPQQNPDFVQKTFSSIAKRYDIANHLLSGGMDFVWRARVARLVAASRPVRILDLATGSGDLAIALQNACPAAYVVGADFCLPMLEEARRKHVPFLVRADGLALPFQAAAFDAVTVAFGLRNMASWEKALSEMGRVLRPGGLLVVLDFSLPPRGLLRNIYRLYLHHILPRIAGWTTGRAEAYEYLGESIEAFPRGAGMAALIESCGFRPEPPRPMCFGIVSLYAARKEAPQTDICDVQS